MSASVRYFSCGAHRDYMHARTGGKVDTTWSKEMAAKAQRPREHMKAFLSSQGFEVE